MERAYSQHAEPLSQGQLLFPSSSTVSEVWPPALSDAEQTPFRISVACNRKALLVSIVALHTLTTLAPPKSPRVAARARNSPHCTWLLSCLLRFWTLALPYLQSSIYSPSKNVWLCVFLDTVGQLTSSLADGNFEALTASRYSSFISQVLSPILLTPGTIEIPHVVQRSLCFVLFEIALLVQKSPTWCPVLFEHLSPTLLKIESKDGKVDGDVSVGQNDLLTISMSLLMCSLH